MPTGFVHRPLKRQPVRVIATESRTFAETDPMVDVSMRFEASLTTLLAKAFASISTVSVAEITTLLDDGDVDALIGRLGAAVDELTLTASVALLSAAGAAAAAKATIHTSDATAPLTGDLTQRTDRRSVAITTFAKDHAAAIVTNITNDTRQAVRAVIAQATVSDMEPRKIARILRDIVGLTPKYAGAVVKYEQGLLNQGVAESRARELAKKYAAKLTRSRAQTIARTEMMAAVHNGQQIAWQQLASNGIIDQNLTMRKWIVAKDERTCPICLPMDGQIVALSKPFLTATGQLMNPPAHPRCRCSVVLVDAPEGTAPFPQPSIFHQTGKHNQIVNMLGISPSTASESRAFHLQGKHDQKSHGRGGSGGGDARLDAMQNGTLELTGSLNGGSNYVYRGTVTGADGTTVEVIGKKRSALMDSSMGGITAKTDHEREVAAFEVNKAMGGRVEMPLVALRKGESSGADMLVMEFKDDVGGTLFETPMKADFFTDKWLTEQGASQMHDMALLDAVIGSQDRHGGNILFREKDGKVDSVVAIDNGLSFPPERNSVVAQRPLEFVNRDVYWGDAEPGAKLRPSDRSALEALKANPPDLSGYLSPAEVGEMNLRVDFMLDRDRFIAKNELGERPWQPTG